MRRSAVARELMPEFEVTGGPLPHFVNFEDSTASPTIPRRSARL
jgi:hypothetical protein